MAWDPSDWIALAAVFSGLGIAATTVIANVYLQKGRLRHEEEMLDKRSRQAREDEARQLAAELSGTVAELISELGVDIDDPDDEPTLNNEDTTKLVRDLQRLAGLTDRTGLVYASQGLRTAFVRVARYSRDDQIPIEVQKEAYGLLQMVYQIFQEAGPSDLSDADVDRLRALVVDIVMKD